MIEAIILLATKSVLDRRRANYQGWARRKAKPPWFAGFCQPRTVYDGELRRGGADGLCSGRQGLRPCAVVPGLTGAAPGDVGGHVALPVVPIQGPQPGGGFAVAGTATGLGRPGPK